MLPNTKNINELILQKQESGRQNTKTFSLNLTNNTIGGKIDGLEALAQSIYLMLNIEADKHIIYPYTYGVSLIDLIGKPSHYVEAVVPGRIKEALMRDDRITNVSNFKFETYKNKLMVEFVVNTIYGEIEKEMVVSF